MPTTLIELVKSKAPEKFAEDAEEQMKEDLKNQKFLTDMLQGKIHKSDQPTFDEAIMTHDYLTLFKKVVTDMMLKPREPDMIGQSILSTTINMPGTFTEVRVPAVGSLIAHEIGQAMEYPEERLAFTEHATSIAIKKYGLKVTIAEEVIKQSQWPIVGMHIDAARLALIRKKEQTIFEGLQTHAWVVYDNSVGFTGGTPVGNPSTTGAIANTALITHGQGYDGNYNGAITLLDLMDQMGQIIANQYTPTDIVMHPLAWVILAKDPILRVYARQSGNVGNAPWLKIGPDAQQSNMPFGIQINVSPFVSYTTTTDPHETHIYVGQRKEGIAVIQGDGPETENFRDARNDTEAMKIREYYGIGLLDLGRAWTVAKHVNVTEHYDIPVVHTV